MPLTHQSLALPSISLQDHFGRAEGYNIVHADEQFFAPTDGKPLRGLIQVGLRKQKSLAAQLIHLFFHLCSPNTG